jgi:hypothetical protein
MGRTPVDNRPLPVTWVAGLAPTTCGMARHHEFLRDGRYSGSDPQWLSGQRAVASVDARYLRPCRLVSTLHGVVTTHPPVRETDRLGLTPRF